MVCSRFIAHTPRMFNRLRDSQITIVNIPEPKKTETELYNLCP